MTEDEFNRLKEKHAVLLRLCKGGERRTIQVKEKNLQAAADEHAFCAVAALNTPEADALVKLFDLKDVVRGLNITPPLGGSEDDAALYVQRFLEALRAEVDKIDDQDIIASACQAVLSKGTYFNAKLMHSSADSPRFLAREKRSGLPHLSSRSVQAFLLDQSSNDSTGQYQQVAKTVNAGSGLLNERTAQAVLEGAKQAFQAKTQRAPRVDARLRQILLPVLNGYASITPIPMGGISVIMSSTAQQIEQREAEREAEARIAEQDEVAAQKKTKGAGRPSKKTVQKPTAIKVRPLFGRIAYPVGGANPQNVSLLNASAITRPFFFAVPQRTNSMAEAVAFAKRGFRIYLTNDELKEVAAQIQGLADEWRNSAGLTARNIQASGPFARLIRKWNARARNLTEALPVDDPEFIESVEKSVLEDTLAKCILSSCFNHEYAEALATKVVCAIERRFQKIIDNDDIGGIDRSRLMAAAIKVLER